MFSAVIKAIHLGFDTNTMIPTKNINEWNTVKQFTTPKKKKKKKVKRKH